MRTSLLVAATPAVVAVGYALLTGYLLNRVKPLPISVMPWPSAEKIKDRRDQREAFAI